MNRVIERARPVIEQTLTAMGYELVDIEYKVMYGDPHLIVYIANEKGVSLDDCEAVSNALDGPLDALDPTDAAPYCLDISSPGLDRPFKTNRDYERNYNTKIEIKLFAPLQGTKRKQFVGVLLSRDGEHTVISEDGNEITFDNKAIALARPYVEF